MADLGTRAEPLGEVARVERQKHLWRREGVPIFNKSDRKLYFAFGSTRNTIFMNVFKQ
jgi:hypothetical protein